MWDLEAQQWEIEKIYNGIELGDFGFKCKYFLNETKDLKTFQDLNKTFPRQRKIYQKLLSNFYNAVWAGNGIQISYRFFWNCYRPEGVWFSSDKFLQIGSDLFNLEIIQNYAKQIVQQLYFYLNVKKKRHNQEEVEAAINKLKSFGKRAKQQQNKIEALLTDIEVIEVIKKGAKVLGYFVRDKKVDKEERSGNE